MQQLREVQKETGVKVKTLFMPIRVATSGQTQAGDHKDDRIAFWQRTQHCTRASRTLLLLNKSASKWLTQTELLQKEKGIYRSDILRSRMLIAIMKIGSEPGFLTLVQSRSTSRGLPC